jgi:hypothetical protein
MVPIQPMDTSYILGISSTLRQATAINSNIDEIHFTYQVESCSGVTLLIVLFDIKVNLNLLFFVI